MLSRPRAARLDLRPIRSFALIAALALGVTEAARGGFEPGQIFVMDSNASAGNGRMFQVDRATGAATPVGNGFGLEPWSLVVLSQSTAYAADATGETVFRLNPATGNWTPVLGSPNLLNYPSAAMVAETDHTLLVASGFGQVIRVDVNSGEQSLFADYGSLGAADPWGMTRLPDGSLIVSDAFNGKIIRIAPNGTPSLVSSGGLLHSAWGIVALPDGSVAVGDSQSFASHSIVRVNLADGSQSYLTPPGSFTRRINDLELDVDGNLLVAAAQNDTNGLLYKVNLSSGLISPFSVAPQFANPAGIVVIPEPAGLGLAVASCVLISRRRRWT